MRNHTYQAHHLTLKVVLYGCRYRRRKAQGKGKANGTAETEYRSRRQRKETQGEGESRAKIMRTERKAEDFVHTSKVTHYIKYIHRFPVQHSPQPAGRLCKKLDGILCKAVVTGVGLRDSTRNKSRVQGEKSVILLDFFLCAKHNTGFFHT